MCCAKPRRYQVLHLCHSETTDEQSNFTQAWIQPAWRQLWKRCQCGAALTAKDERNLRKEKKGGEKREREGEKVMGREKGRPTQTDMLPIRHISYFYSCKDCQVHYTARVEEQVLEVCSWHSAETFRTTSLYFIQHLAKACLFVQCNANSNLSQCHSPRDLLKQQKSQASWSHGYSPPLSHYEFCTVTAATEASPCLTKQLLSTVLYYWLAEEQAPRFLSFFFFSFLHESSFDVHHQSPTLIGLPSVSWPFHEILAVLFIKCRGLHIQIQHCCMDVR